MGNPRSGPTSDQPPFNVFDALGLDCTPSISATDVRAAFRRATLHVHPSKINASQPYVPSFPTYAQLRRARDYLLQTGGVNYIRQAYQSQAGDFASTWDAHATPGTIAATFPRINARVIPFICQRAPRPSTENAVPPAYRRPPGFTSLTAQSPQPPLGTSYGPTMPSLKSREQPFVPHVDPSTGRAGSPTQSSSSSRPKPLINSSRTGALRSHPATTATPRPNNQAPPKAPSRALHRSSAASSPIGVTPAQPPPRRSRSMPQKTGSDKKDSAPVLAKRRKTTPFTAAHLGSSPYLPLPQLQQPTTITTTSRTSELLPIPTGAAASTRDLLARAPTPNSVIVGDVAVRGAGQGRRYAVMATVTKRGRIMYQRLAHTWYGQPLPEVKGKRVVARAQVRLIGPFAGLTGLELRQTVMGIACGA